MSSNPFEAKMGFFLKAYNIHSRNVSSTAIDYEKIVEKALVSDLKLLESAGCKTLYYVEVRQEGGFCLSPSYKGVCRHIRLSYWLDGDLLSPPSLILVHSIWRDEETLELKEDIKSRIPTLNLVNALLK